MVNGKKTTRYRYNKNNELLREDNGRITAYHYDNRGNQVGTVLEQIEKVPDNTPAYTMSLTLGDNRLNGNEVNHYNALNQVETTLTRNYKIRYEYNADGLRTKKSVNTSRRGYVDTNYVWDGDQLVFELDKDYNIKKRYVRGQSLVYADTGEGTNKTYFVTDDQGSVIQLVDEQGTIIKTYSYDAFGTEISKDNNQTDNNPFRYCGEYHDIETGYIYLRARYYNPVAGRFISEDPAFDGDNWYVYCENDPINRFDPSGLCSISSHIKKYAKNIKSWDLKKANRGPIKFKFGTGHSHKITMTAKAKISGNAANLKYYVNGGYNGKMTYKKLIKNAIQDYWKGSFNLSFLGKSFTNKKHCKVKLVTKLNYTSNSNSFKIKMNKGGTLTKKEWENGEFKYWANASFHGTMNLYAKEHYPKLNDDDVYNKKDAKYTSYDDQRWGVAHEFGHILGVDDMYTKSDYIIQKYDPKGTNIMNAHGGKVTGSVLRRAIRAHCLDKWQTWK